jgi:hypothetical protein
MSQNEKTSTKVATLAAKAMQNPGSLSPQEIKELAASVLTQSPDRQSPDRQPQQGQQKK